MFGQFRNLPLFDAGSRLRRFVPGVLFRKYFALVGAAMGAALVASSLIDIWFAARDQRAGLMRLQREQASAAASRITGFIKDIEGQLGWMTHFSWTDAAAEQRELDASRLLRQVPAISVLSLLDGDGRERLRVSRQAMDRLESLADLSGTERFKAAIAGNTYYGPVEFRRGTEPIMTLAVGGARRDTGVTVAEVNLTHIWDVVHSIRVGRGGRVYVVGAEDRLIAHPDLSLVLRNTDMSQLPPVRAARAGDGNAADPQSRIELNVEGERVLTTSVRADPLNWLVFVELPETEANAPLYAEITRSAVILLLGLGLALAAAVLLARRMVIPIQTLGAGAARIGSGALDHRIAIRTGDELEALGTEFNAMATHLQSSYALLERKVEERTAELQAANLSKSRFLAAASHDLRQPLHALNLLVEQYRNEGDRAERLSVATRIDKAVANMNELFNALLDISKLDAGALETHISSFPVCDVLNRVEATFAAVAQEKGLHFAMVASSFWVRSDGILLERILNNLISNAVRYTHTGGVVVGCRHHAGGVRIDVCDSGVGIPQDQQRIIFAEFYRGAQVDRQHGDGLGLGLAIVDRLAALLDHPVEVHSTAGRGSRFSILVPRAMPDASGLSRLPQALPPLDPLRGKHVLVIDDDELVREGTRGLLKSWGCIVVAVETEREALASLDRGVPDLIIADYRLSEGAVGMGAIAALREASGVDIPAFMVSGDVGRAYSDTAADCGLQLLHKPVTPMNLRAMMTRLLRARVHH